MRTDRRRLAALLAIGALAAIGCSADPGKMVGAAPTGSVMEVATAAPTSSASAPVGAQEYVLADVTRRSTGTFVSLSKGTTGVLVDGARAIVSESGTTFASEVTVRALTRVDVVPPRLGGGFLFRSNDAIFTSPTFDGALRPLLTAPDTISSISFGTNAMLVRASGGERWLIDVATGARKAPTPLGLIDVVATEDGRAIAVTEAGGASVTTNGGKTWRDARGDLRGAPTLPFERDGELWISDRVASGDRPLRLERSGALVEMGSSPPAPAPPKLDTRFANGETPLKFALRNGVRAGPWSAVIGAGGDVMRVDLATGAITSTVAGVLPPRMTCKAVEVPDDIALVCSERGHASVVVTKIRSGKEPRVERSFPKDGPFYASDDGAIAFGGPCGPPENDDKPAQPATTSTSSGKAAPSAPAPLPTVCARNDEGVWEQFVLDPEAGKVRGAGHNAKDPDADDDDAASGSGGKSSGGKSASKPAASSVPGPTTPKYRLTDVRWVPRLGRPPIALIAGTELAFYDPAWGEIRTWKTSAAENDLVAALRRHVDPAHDAPLVDQRWSAGSSGAVEAMLDDGRSVEISPSGTITAWPFTYEKAGVAGRVAFAKGPNGRAFQTLDRGRTWSEIAAPPGAGTPVFDVRGCSALGCDLGQWLRVGWNPSTPSSPMETKKVQNGPTLTSAPLLKIACLATAQVQGRAFHSKLDDQLDVGLGATPLPTPVMDGFAQFETHMFGRTPLNVALSGLNIGMDTAPRAFQSGYAPTLLPPEREDEVNGKLGTLGPSRAASAFKPEIAFVEPLVPSAPIRRVTYGFDPITRAVKGSGVSVEDLLMNGNLELSATLPITPAATKGKAAAPGDLLVMFTPTHLGTLLLVARGGASPRAEMLFTRRYAFAQSAARLPNGDLVVLAIDDMNQESVLRFGGGGVSELATLPDPPSYAMGPPNPDVVAINAKGDVAVLRTPSGIEPATADDPALLILPGPRLVALAPWSAALPASDPACAASPDDMYRVTLQTQYAWAQIAGRPLFDAAMTGMTARVRWSPTQLCVEAIDVPEHNGQSPTYHTTETIVTATFAPNDAGRNTIELGAESRESLSCMITP
ncbi:MAG: hypothetical protein U0441_11080 [Polyangiaceae bacterium]